MQRTITGANLFRSTVALQAADVFGIDTAPILIAPAIPGKILMPIAVLGRIAGQTVPFAPSSNAAAFLCYSSTYDPNLVAYPGEILANLISTDLGVDGALNFLASGPAIPLGELAGLPLFLIASTRGFAAGSVIGATVTPGHGGTGYGNGDTGFVHFAHSSPNAQYQVTAETGGIVSAVSIIAGGGGYVPGTYTTTISTGGGDGTLELNISSGQIDFVGNGTTEIDVLYQPI